MKLLSRVVGIHALITITLAVGLLAGVLPPATASGGAPVDSLTLQAPTNVRVWSVYNPVRRGFVVWLKWEDTPDSCGTFIHPADTTGWSAGLPAGTVPRPIPSGTYNGDIDRTVRFISQDSSDVGVGQLRIDYEIRKEEHYSGRIRIGSTYTPGAPVSILFDDSRTPATEQIDFGLRISVPAGTIGVGREFRVGMEDFEGFHMWRGVKSDGSDLVVIGEISKEEAVKGRLQGGELVDSLYLYQIVPTLRSVGTWFSQFGAIDCLGTRITLPLAANEFFWFDCNAFNGFTYQYAVTSFDRDYEVGASRQGLQKFDHCTVTGGLPYPCPNELNEIVLEVASQDEMYRVYAVPNPYRTGGSRLTTDNYHNFPDDMVRFVNLPDNCLLRVYTVSGDLVWEKDHDDLTGNLEWDTRNQSGELVNSGVYIFRVERNTGDNMFGRLVIIR